MVSVYEQMPWKRWEELTLEVYLQRHGMRIIILAFSSSSMGSSSTTLHADQRSGVSVPGLGLNHASAPSINLGAPGLFGGNVGLMAGRVLTGQSYSTIWETLFKRPSSTFPVQSTHARELPLALEIASKLAYLCLGQCISCFTRSIVHPLTLVIALLRLLRPRSTRYAFP